MPEYRLPKTVVNKEIAFIRGAGVQFKFNAALGKQLTLNALTETNDAVFLALGTGEEQPLGIPGEEANGVYSSLAFLNEKACGREPKIGRKVTVVGGGNSAIDAARTALRIGADVTIVYRRSREDMPAIREETEQALQEGVKLITMAAPVRIVTDQNGCITGMEVARTVPGEFDSRGRRSPVVTKDTYVVECDTILKAIGEKQDRALTKTLGLELTPWGSLKVDPWTLRTSHPKVFAGGDYITGAANVSTAMGYGKKAAEMIDRQLTGLDRFEELWPKFECSHTVPPPGQGGSRTPTRVLSVEERRGKYVDVSPTFTEWQARGEALRCLRCDIKAGNGEHAH